MLSQGGLAAISYNVLPGWHMRSVVRDICLRHAGDGTPMERVARARAILEEIASSARETEPYGLLIRNEAGRAARRPASYILGEFLVPHNSPCHFSEFVLRAAAHELTYVCEAELEASVPETLYPAFQARLRKSAGSDLQAVEQYIDDFTGRTFRCSVLAKTGAVATAVRDYAHLQHLHVSGDLQAEGSDDRTASSVFKDGQGRKIRTSDPCVARALTRLAAAYPNTTTIAALSAADDAGAFRDEGQAADRVCQALSVLIAAGQVEITSLPRRTGLASDDWPCASAVARSEAAAGQPWITSLQHTPVPSKPAVALLLPYMDGRRDRGQLTRICAEALERGALRVPEQAGQGEAAGGEDFDGPGAIYVDRVIAYLARHGVLESQAPDPRSAESDTSYTNGL